MYIMYIPLLTVATVFRLQTNVCKRHHRITLCRNPQLLWFCRYLYPIIMDSISAQGIYTLIVQSSILFCHTRYGSFFICPLDKQKELPPFNCWDESSQQFHLSCQKALPSGLPSKGNIPLKSLLFSLGRFVPTKSYQGSCAPFVYLCTLPRLTSLIGKTIRLVFSFTDFSSVNDIYSILNELTYMELPQRTIKSLGRTVPDYPNTNSERIGIISFP